MIQKVRWCIDAPREPQVLTFRPGCSRLAQAIEYAIFYVGFSALSIEFFVNFGGFAQVRLFPVL